MVAAGSPLGTTSVGVETVQAAKPSGRGSKPSLADGDTEAARDREGARTLPSSSGGSTQGPTDMSGV